MTKNTKEFASFFEQELNNEQKEAVLHTKGPLLVISGAGSGKTRIITSRIVHLLRKEQVHPAQIIALTFTNKAAKEMRERIQTFLDTGEAVPFIGTFHAYCLYLLKTNTHLLPYKTFSILDEDDKRTLLQSLLKKSNWYKQITAQQLSYQISSLKNQCDPLSKSSIYAGEQDRTKELFEAYESEKRTAHCFDFDDLLLETSLLFQNKQFQKDHQDQVQHILVDEYQDTNRVQHHLLKAMTLEKNKFAIESLCAVGDEDQSIYSWRGATVENMVHFKKDFEDTVTIKIEQNYRSKNPILQVANTVITNNKKRHKKNLWSDREGRDCVRTMLCLSGYQEADIIAQFAKLLHSEQKLKQCAILYRTHAQSRVIEEALIKQTIPYHITGGIRFYERKEIKDLLAYLRLIVNTFDRIALLRVINCPTRGLGDVFQESFLQLWEKEPFLDFKQCAEKIAVELHGQKKESLAQFIALFTGLTKHSSTSQVISHFLEKTNYLFYVKETYEKQEAEDRIANIRELINAAHFFAEQNKASVGAFLQEVSLLVEQSSYEKEEKQGITLMTIHAAKGLEFDNVIIPGLEEQIFPSSRSSNDKEQLEEERRLLYVGITRAKNRLLLLHATYRQLYGTMEHAVPSRFLDEIPSSYCTTTDARSLKNYDISAYFSQWTGIQRYNPQVFTFNGPLTTQPKQHQPIVESIEIKNSVHKSSIEKPSIKQSTRNTTSSTFKKHQTIKHATFGIGIIKEIEQKQGKTFITVLFKDGVKKIESSFLNSV